MRSWGAFAVLVKREGMGLGWGKKVSFEGLGKGLRMVKDKKVEKEVTSVLGKAVEAYCYGEL